ncbi:MAG: hypothetical protein FWH18_04860 [Marinilabiliaceae bacterium]|nr:hypothetical protein [Marinilabiliaceae bacterium]
MKKKQQILILLCTIVFVICCITCNRNKKDVDLVALGKKAGIEMCECYKDENSDDECFEELESKYEKYEDYVDFADAFIDAFEDCMLAFIEETYYNEGKQAAIEKCECDKLENELYDECMKVWNDKYLIYLIYTNKIFLEALEIEYEKCSE